MGGRIRTRIAVLVLALVALSAATTCYVIALNAQDAVESATRSRLTVLASFLRETVERNVRLGTSLRGPTGLQAILDTAVARDQDLDMVAILGRSGAVLVSAGRDNASSPFAHATTASAPAAGREPQVTLVGDEIVIRVALNLDYASPLRELVIRVPKDRLDPDVERLITLLFRGALILVLVLAPVILAGTWLILNPATRSIGIVAAALDAIGHGREPRIPTTGELGRARGDPYWDQPDRAELAMMQMHLIERLQAAREGLGAAQRSLQQLDRRVTMLDTDGPAALSKIRPDAAGEPS